MVLKEDPRLLIRVELIICIRPHEKKTNFFLHYGDMTDATNLIRLIQKLNQMKFIILLPKSHVMVSFETAEYTANADALGTLRILEAIRILGLEKNIKYYQASTSELYGKIQENPQTEKTPFILEAHMPLQNYTHIG